jgi:hypothetical protein
MRKTLIAMTAVSALVLGFSCAAFAGNHTGNGNGGNGNGNHSGNDVNNHSGNDVNNGHNTAIIGSSLINVGGQLNGAHSVSGVLNDQNNTGNFSTQNNNAPAVVLVF